MPQKSPALLKTLGLVDIFAICTGAMFSSGFFLLPGLAAKEGGPAVVLSYLLAGFLILPAMLSKAELATAMPRAGGTYYYLDRSLGPLAGTVGGLGAWLALVLKSAFALLGIGAYASLFWELPVRPLALALTAVFAVLNIIGAKESSGLQRILVGTLLAILIGFLVFSGISLAGADRAVLSARFTPFFTNGFDGVAGTIGLVFVSYAGLTKVASVAEEVRNPDRAIPLGMMLSLATATFVYVLGVAAIVALIPAAELHTDLTPVATAAARLPIPLPTNVVVGGIAIAALAAFASTGNAGLLAASRYPMAMARDRLLPAWFARVSKQGTPVRAILFSAGLMAFTIAVLDVQGVAKLASAFQLALFGLVNLAVIVMRESRIEYYRPGFKSPLYPWVQILGLAVPVWLVVQMGWFTILSTLLAMGLCVLWYRHYAHDRVVRDGAIYHVLERLGRRRYDGLDHELRGIMSERGLKPEDPFEQLVSRAHTLDLEGVEDFDKVMHAAAKELGLDDGEVLAPVHEEARLRLMPHGRGALLPHVRRPGEHPPALVLVRIRAGIPLPEGVAPTPGCELLKNAEESGEHHHIKDVHAVILLVGSEQDHGQHYRLLAQLADRIEQDDFITEWMDARTHELRLCLLAAERFVHLRLFPELRSGELIGREVRSLGLPSGSLVALLRRDGHNFVPAAGERLREGDLLTIISDPEGIRGIRERYGLVPQRRFLRQALAS